MENVTGHGLGHFPLQKLSFHWVALKELLGFRCLGFRELQYPSIMENQREKTMENEMDTGGILRFKELDLSYCIGEAVLITIYTHYNTHFGSLI